MTQNLKIRACLMQNFMELDLKKFSDPKALDIEVQDLKTSLGKFDPKAFDKGLIKPFVKNSTISFIIF